MTKHFIKIVSLLSILLLLFSCRSNKIEQGSMFNGRKHKNKKGVYDAGMKGNKPISVQIKKDFDKLSKYDTNPRKARKKNAKEMKKKKKTASKARNKNNRKRHVKVKTTKGKSSGDN